MGASDLFYLPCGEPTFAPILQLDEEPARDAAVLDEDLGALVDDKLVGRGRVGRLLHRHRTAHDDGSTVVLQLLLLLPGKERAEQEEDAQRDGGVSSCRAADAVACGEKDRQGDDQEHQREDAADCPRIDGHEIDQRPIARDEEELRLRRDLVDGLGPCHLEVEADVAVARSEQQGALVGEDGVGDVVQSVVGVAEVVIDVG